MKTLIDELEKNRALNRREWETLFTEWTAEDAEYLFEKSRRVSQSRFGNKIYIRGLIEISSYCKNNCYYCGIRRDNRSAERYRLTEEEILACCETGYGLGFRTFVLQGGEDSWYTPGRLVSLVSAIRQRYPDCAITLSLGEMEKEVYQSLFDAGANRYLLRHEAADPQYYRELHPPEMSWEHRMGCLRSLKEIGYQTGAGFMVGAPGQTPARLAEEMLFLRELNPEMVGIGPYLPHKDTPFRHCPAGSMDLTLFLLGLLRLMLPGVLLPATTALGTIHPRGRELGILAGANVVMPNLSPTGVRKKYSLYDNKICMGEEAAEGRARLQKRMEAIGYTLVTDRGDYKVGEENV